MTAVSQDAVTDLERENARLLAELRTARDRQDASAEILRTIANVSGDAEQSLLRIAEITARLFGAPSVTIQIAEGDGWSHTIRFGDNAKRVGATVPINQLRIGGKNMPGMIVAQNRQIHVPDLDNVDPAYADWPGLPPSRAAGTRTMAGTPLRREGKAIGVMIVYLNRLAPFTDEELALQQSFADQAAIAIENARLFNETREALERQTATADILKVIASSPSDVQPVFAAIAESAKRLLGAFSTTVLRFIGEELHLVAYTPTDPAADETLKASFPRLLEEFPAFALVRDGKTVQFADTESEDVPPANRELGRLRGFRSVLFTPLMSQGTPIGMISVTRAEPGAFAPQHVQLLQTFADQAVIAIENVRLFNETQEALERQTASANILRAIAASPTDVAPVLNAIVESACELCEAIDAVVFLKDGDRLRYGAHHGPIPVVFDEERGIDRTYLAGRSVIDKVPIRVRDVFSEEGVEFPVSRELSRSGGIRSILCVPLLRDDESIGTILLRRTEVHPFSEKHVALLQTFADQAVIAIENVRLFDEVQARTEDLRESLQQQTATADVLKVISRSTFDLQAVLDTLVESAARLCEADKGVIFKRDGDLYRWSANFGNPPELEAFAKANPFRPGHYAVTSRVALEGKTFHVPDVLTDPEYGASAYQKLGGYRTILGVPLLRAGTPIGVFALTRSDVKPFTPKQVELVESFADQAVIAIENVRLFDEVQARTRDLSESLQQQTATADVLKVISRSAFDLQTVLDTLVESAARLCDADRACVFQKSGELFHWVSNYGFSDELIAYANTHPFAAGPGSTTSRVALEGKAIHNPDVLADPNYKASEYQRLGNYRTMLGIPLLREGAPIGVFILAREQVRPFTDRQIELVTSFADQAVIAIENVRLFDEVQARTMELAASLDELRTAQDRLVQTEKLASLGQLTAGIAHEIKNPLNFVNNFSSLSAELTDELNDVLKQATLSDTIREEVDELTGLLKDNLQKVVQHGRRADSIVKNMLLHSREGSGDHRPADINALLDESLNLAYHGARAEKPQFNVTLQRDFDEKAGTIEVFPQEITRVFLNLISNGFYAVAKRKTENGGSDFEPTLRATTKSLGDAVEIRIRDNGTGIPTEVKEKMFNPFFTTKPAGEGTGLGLSMSHDIIVKQHGGSIDVATEPEQFTEFTIVLPRTSSLQIKKRGQS